MTCPHCGETTGSDTTLCPHCGRPADGPLAPANRLPGERDDRIVAERLMEWARLEEESRAAILKSESSRAALLEAEEQLETLIARSIAVAGELHDDAFDLLLFLKGRDALIECIARDRCPENLPGWRLRGARSRATFDVTLNRDASISVHPATRYTQVSFMDSLIWAG